MKTLYFDCFSGISGDMTIGALLDLGLDFEYLKAELCKLPVDGYTLSASRTVRSNISAMKFDVVMEKGGDGHKNGHEHGAHYHQRASQILSMISESSLSPNVKRLAGAIFTRLAISEGKVHHISPEDVEFHEVGAVDSIVDTVGAAIGFDALGVGCFICSPINVGGGFIHCQHGIYPVPAPATADLLRNATIYSKHASAELVTPTGAAILAAVVDEFASMPGLAVEKIGYGAGTRRFQNFPNCLRLMLCSENREAAEKHEAPSSDTIVVLEANIDDMSAQNFAYVCDRLMEAGALDVVTIPIQMKKGRPGHLLQVLAPQNCWKALERQIFEETTTIGIRRHETQRSALEREFVQVETGLGAVSIKVSKLGERVVNSTPEYEDCARIARKYDIPLKEVQALAMKVYLTR